MELVTLARRCRTLSSGLALAVLAAGEVSAQPDPAATADAAAPAPGATRLPAVVVRGRAESLIGVADSASQGSVGAAQLERRPLSRPGEVLETVPGLIATQHSGSGKANQFFLRGFNLDHGTDFATSIDGVPLNLPSHGHGQGYTDLNFLIPELVERVDFRKGPYAAEKGDFASAGSADLHYFRELPQKLVLLEGGMFSYLRAVLAASSPVRDGSLLYALELMRDNGPWDHADHFRKLNGVLRYSRGDAENGWSLTASAYAGRWDATDQIAQRALELPGFDRFDSLDTSDGGDSQKYMLYGEWHRSDADGATRLLGYGFHQDLTLFSNFTFFLSSPQGDQFQQIDRRWVGGASARHDFFGQLDGRAMENSVGLQLRSDSIRNGLFQTVRRRRTDKLDHAGGAIAATTRRDEIWELSLAPYFENRIQWHEKLRSIAGVRLDAFRFDVKADRGVDSGTDAAVLVSPSGSLVLGPFADTELYLSGGLGFHSNDARGVTAPVEAADPLVRTRGAELGVRTARLPGLHSTLALWWLDIDSELIFVGDAGSTEASRPSRRYGIEFGNYYEATRWLTLDLDWSLSKARFRDDDPAGDRIPGSIENVIAAGASLHDLGGFFGELRLRWFGPRALIEDDSVRSSKTVLLSARLGYEFGSRWKLSAEFFNLLDRKDSEIDYFYPSRLGGEPAGPDEGGFSDVHFHPVSPRSVRVALSARF